MAESAMYHNATKLYVQNVSDIANIRNLHDTSNNNR